MYTLRHYWKQSTHSLTSPGYHPLVASSVTCHSWPSGRLSAVYTTQPPSYCSGCRRSTMELSPENLARFPCLVVLKGEGLGMKSETTDGGVAIAKTRNNMWEGLVGMYLKLITFSSSPGSPPGVYLLMTFAPVSKKGESLVRDAILFRLELRTKNWVGEI